MSATSCCRSLPRCASCPARLADAARRRKRVEGVASVIDEVLCGGCARTLPPAVVDALAQLRDARSPRTAARV
jgi:predicted metal-binding protein